MHKGRYAKLSIATQCGLSQLQCNGRPCSAKRSLRVGQRWRTGDPESRMVNEKILGHLGLQACALLKKRFGMQRALSTAVTAPGVMALRLG